MILGRLLSAGGRCAWPAFPVAAELSTATSTTDVAAHSRNKTRRGLFTFIHLPELEAAAVPTTAIGIGTGAPAGNPNSAGFATLKSR
jgi:hypothetical protein